MGTLPSPRGPNKPAHRPHLLHATKMTTTVSPIHEQVPHKWMACARDATKVDRSGLCYIGGIKSLASHLPVNRPPPL